MAADPTDAVYERADRAMRDRISRMDLQALLEEHRKLPYGPHSDELARLLTYFRRADTDGKHVVYSQTDSEGWVIGRLDGQDGRPRIDFDTTKVYPSSDLAQQAVLEARLENLRNLPGGSQ
jgi:hypothetical protein